MILWVACYKKCRCQANWWWLRSPNINWTLNFWNVNTDGNVNNNNAGNWNGVCFGFCYNY